MKETAEESAELKMALKHDPVTDTLRGEAEAFPVEAGEAIDEVARNLDSCEPDSWVAHVCPICLHVHEHEWTLCENCGWDSAR